ncbi:MAG: ribonuclease T2 [Hyphomicrobiales bacterium]|nr:ribonuclease T2 [Hyphomicrobiales bacterium]
MGQRRIRLALAVLAGAALLFSVAATRAEDPHERYGASPGDFDLYVFSLSWSPGFCEIEGDRKRKLECFAGAALGFQVHGLWPQYENGDYPTYCDRSRNFVPGASLSIARQIYRDKGLAIGEWRKHGECTGLDPSAYYQAESALFHKIRIPATLVAPAQALRATPREIAQAFARVNPGVVEPEMVSVSCRRGELEEVRFCVSKDLSGFRACGEAAPDACDAGEITIAPLR